METEDVNLRSEITLLSQIDQKCNGVFQKFLDIEVCGVIVMFCLVSYTILKDVHPYHVSYEVEIFVLVSENKNAFIMIVWSIKPERRATP